MSALEAELEKIMERLRTDYEVLPFLDRLLGSSELTLKPLPDDMHDIARRSVDWMEPAPGVGPVWVELAAGNDVAEIIVYRALFDKVLYIVAP